MLNPNKYTVEKITSIKQWTDHLFSFRTTRSPNFNFIPGQFARLGIQDTSDSGVWRPYSIVTATTDPELEFYSILVPDGKFTQRLKNLTSNSEILIDKINYGLLTTNRFTSGKHLWFLSTGTGLAPFISMLYDKAIWQEYTKVVLVHCARTQDELVYQELINNFYHHAEYAPLVANKLIYIKALTRETKSADLYGRITELLMNNQLEQYANLPINNIEDSRIMLCGNPAMVKDMRQILTDRGLTMSRKDTPGNIVAENYW